jgi:hypothetical protein
MHVFINRLVNWHMAWINNLLAAQSGAVACGILNIVPVVVLDTAQSRRGSAYAIKKVLLCCCTPRSFQQQHPAHFAISLKAHLPLCRADEGLNVDGEAAKMKMTHGKGQSEFLEMS